MKKTLAVLLGILLSVPVWVVAQQTIASNLVRNQSGVSGTTVTDALNTLNTGLSGKVTSVGATDGSINVAGTATAPTLRFSIPWQTQVSGASKTYVAADMGKGWSRTNSGSPMTDTLPAITAAMDGATITLANDDSTLAATDTISAAAGQFIVNATGGPGASSFVQYFSRRTQMVAVWNGGTNPFWRVHQNNNNLTKGKSGSTFTAGHIAVVSSTSASNGNEIDDSGNSFPLANSALANSSISIAGNSTALGGSVTQDQITGLSSTGIVKRTAANTLAIATAGTDYATATNGSSGDLLRSNGAGGFGTALTPGSGCATWLATPSSSNFAACITGETGTGNVVFSTGPTLSPAFLSGRCYADQQAGATADVQINACNTTLTGLGGGTIDATGFGCTTQSINAVTSVGDATGHPVTLVLDRCTQYNVTVTGGSSVDAIKLFSRSSITTVGMGNPLVASFVVQATTNVNSIIATYPRASQWVGMVQGVIVEGNTSATVLSVYDVSGAVATARFMDVGEYSSNGNGLKITANAGSTVDSFLCDNCSMNGAVSTTGCPVLIDGTASSNLIVGVTFMLGTLVHPGASCASHAIVDIEGGASDTVQGVQFYGTRLESSNTSDIGILVNNALNIGIHDVSASANVNNGTSVVKITQTANVSYNIVVDNLAQFNAWTNTIQDVPNVITYTGAAFPRIARYDVKPPQDSSWSAVQGGVVMRLPRTCKLIADHAGSSSATLGNITWANSCVFQVDASTTYRYECDVIYTETSTSGGLRMGITGPASPVASNYALILATAVATSAYSTLSQTTTYSTAGIGANVVTITTAWPAHFSGTFENGTTAGTLSIQFANGSATGSVVPKRGTACTVY